MSMELEPFLDAAMKAGVARRLDGLRRDLDRAIADYPLDRDTRYMQRLESQRLRVTSPDLSLIVNMLLDLEKDCPQAFLAARTAAEPLADRHPSLRRLLAPTLSVHQA